MTNYTIKLLLIVRYKFGYMVPNISKKRRNQRTRTDRSRNTHSNCRHSRMTQVPPVHHPRLEEMFDHPLRVTNIISTHHPHPVATCIHLYHPHSSIYPSLVRS